MVLGKVQLHFSHVNIQFSQHQLFKRLISPIEWLWHPCQKSFGHIFKGLFLGSVLCSFGLYVISVPHCFNYCFEIKKCEPQALFFFKTVLAIWSPLRVYVNFRMDFFISTKNTVILIGIALKLQIALGSTDNSIVFLSMNMGCLSVYLCLL